MAKQQLTVQEREELRRQFIKTVLDRFNMYQKEEKSDILTELIRFLIGCDLISEATLKKFVVISIYPHLLKKNDGAKMRTLWQIEDLTGFSSVYINSVLKNYSNKYYFNKNRLE